MSDVIYCINCKMHNDCEEAEFCGCCTDGEELEDENEETC